MRGAAGGGSAGRTGRAVPRERPLVPQPVAHGDEPPREVVGARDRPARAIGDVRHEPARVARPREREGVRADLRHRVRQPVAQVVRERLCGDGVGRGEEVAGKVGGKGFDSTARNAAGHNTATVRRHADPRPIAVGIPWRKVRGMGEGSANYGNYGR